MFIGIDASRAARKIRTGTENYSRNLIFNLAKIDKSNSYILYVGPDYDGCFDTLGKNFNVKIIQNKRFWTQIGLSSEMLRSKPDVLFVPSHILPLVTPKKTVVTIHDLAWKYFPQAYSKGEIRLQNLAIKRAIKKKSRIIVYSKSTASDLKKFYRIDSDRIHFVSMGFAPSASNAELSVNLKDKIDGKYILSVGRLESKKNLVNLIKAYTMLRSEKDTKEKLVLVGKPGYGYYEIKQEIDQNKKFKNDIILTGFVSDYDLAALYSHASLFAFPSFYEGFGFPVLEAFAAGVPVVTSKTSSMPEVAGSGALFINPEKPFEIAAAMSQILNKPELAKKLVDAGKDQLKKYSWDKCAEETLAVLEGK